MFEQIIMIRLQQHHTHINRDIEKTSVQQKQYSGQGRFPRSHTLSLIEHIHYILTNQLIIYLLAGQSGSVGK